MPAKKPTFEEAMQQLEQIAQTLSEGRLTLDESAKLYEKGISLLKYCQKELDSYEAKIETLSASTGEITERSTNA